MKNNPPQFNCSELISWPMTWTVVSFCHRFGSCSIWQFEGTWQGLLEAKRVNALLLPAGWLWLGVVQSRICWCQGARDTTTIFSIVTTCMCMELAQVSTGWLFALKARAIISITLLGVFMSSSWNREIDRSWGQWLSKIQFQNLVFIFRLYKLTWYTTWLSHAAHMTITRRLRNSSNVKAKLR